MLHCLNSILIFTWVTPTCRTSSEQSRRPHSFAPCPGGWPTSLARAFCHHQIFYVGNIFTIRNIFYKFSTCPCQWAPDQTSSSPCSPWCGSHLRRRTWWTDFQPEPLPLSSSRIQLNSTVSTTEYIVYSLEPETPINTIFMSRPLYTPPHSAANWN